jgi:hypothetical protein
MRIARDNLPAKSYVLAMAADTPIQRFFGEGRQIPESELRSSILAVGALLPVYRWRGRTIDGQRRERILRGSGKSVRVVELKTEQQAARVLWALHPSRCLTVFPRETLREAADLYGAEPAAVAAVKAATFPREPPPVPARRGWVSRHKADHITSQVESFKVQFWIGRALRESMRRARTLDGYCSEAAFIRRAIAHRVACLEEEHPEGP